MKRGPKTQSRLLRWLNEYPERFGILSRATGYSAGTLLKIAGGHFKPEFEQKRKIEEATGLEQEELWK